MKNFALIGAAGYIAPRHMKAIAETGNCLAAAIDKSDSVGIIDSFFPNADFFTEFERFDRHVEKLKRLGDAQRIHYVSIASPNYLHDAHIRFALRIGAHAICEKPLVLNPWNIDALKQLEHESAMHVYPVLQLRLHPAIVELKKQIAEKPAAKKAEINLNYITARGKWYFYSWKGDEAKSGGITVNIGIHFFDMLLWIFGAVQHSIVHVLTPTRAAGCLELEKARIRWFLSLNEADLPEPIPGKHKRSYRALTIDATEFNFSDGFSDLHTHLYQSILAGSGQTIDDARPAIDLTHAIRHSQPIGLQGDYHPYLKTLAGIH